MSKTLTRSLNFFERAQAYCNYTTHKMAANEDTREFSEELQEKGSECPSKIKKRKADSGKRGKVSKPRRWSSEEVDLLIDQFKKQSCFVGRS